MAEFKNIEDIVIPEDFEENIHACVKKENTEHSCVGCDFHKRCYLKGQALFSRDNLLARAMEIIIEQRDEALAMLEEVKADNEYLEAKLCEKK